MSKIVERDAVRLVSQWCPSVEEIVNLQVKGSVFGDLINGKVIGCDKTRCHAKNTVYCWLEKHIQTKLA
jgi:hypothetical protein